MVVGNPPGHRPSPQDDDFAQVANAESSGNSGAKIGNELETEVGGKEMEIGTATGRESFLLYFIVHYGTVL